METAKLLGLLAAFTILGQVLVLVILGSIIGLKRSHPIRIYLKNFANQASFMVALISTLGSLYLSEISLLDPCKLCWYQRIAMYPMVLILGIAIWRKDKAVKKYVLSLSVIGALIASYHYFIQRLSFAAACSATATSCTTSYTMAFGYITIPLMALTAFLMIATLQLANN